MVRYRGVIWLLATTRAYLLINSAIIASVFSGLFCRSHVFLLRLIDVDLTDIGSKTTDCYSIDHPHGFADTELSPFRGLRQCRPVFGLLNRVYRTCWSCCRCSQSPFRDPTSSLLQDFLNE